MTAVSGDLESLGLEEIEPGLVADTVENRRAIRAISDDTPWGYDEVRDEDGDLTGLIRPRSPADRTAMRSSETKHEKMKPVLVKASDPWSDYRDPETWPMDVTVVPHWVSRRMRKLQERLDNGESMTAFTSWPIRCETTRADGTRCWMWASDFRKSRHCTYHGNYSPELNMRKAQIARIKTIEYLPRAVDNLIDLAEYAVSETVRLGANNSILDRGGLRAGTDINVSGEITHTVDAAEMVRAKLTELGKRVEVLPILDPADDNSNSEIETVDAEIVDEPR